ncbi:DUF4352 domain-containing protein [Longispora albida]|uniref:DUF4352 domain-containing protein n=1 Tax=Longispora albida TaxID=203523 RepID=UPI0012FBC516|nr:DUF4352 domain-containing protein [Longispora albida]
MPVPKKKNKTILWVLLGVGVVFALCCGGGMIAALTSADKDSAGPTADTTVTSTASSTPAASKAAPAAPAPAPDPGIGVAVRDGTFEFTVTKVGCGTAQVGGQYLNKKAQGQFCLVTITVKNAGDKPQTMFDSNQKAHGANNVTYSTDSVATLYANSDGSQVWITEINPGNQVTGLLVFDIPKDAKLATLEVHDSSFSKGAKIRLQ